MVTLKIKNLAFFNCIATQQVTFRQVQTELNNHFYYENSFPYGFD